MAVLAQDSAAAGMKGGNQGGIAGTEQLLHPLGHLFGCLVGKGHGQDVPVTHPMFTDQMHNPVGDHPGLAGTGPGQDQKRAFGMLNGLLLRFVEVG